MSDERFDHTVLALRRACGHDSRTVDECLNCEAAERIERLISDLRDSYRVTVSGMDKQLIKENEELRDKMDQISDAIPFKHASGYSNLHRAEMEVSVCPVCHFADSHQEGCWVEKIKTLTRL